MDKSIVKTTFAILLAALLLPNADGFACVHSQANEWETTPFESGLIAPQSYKEYLPLRETYDVGVSERYTAIADGKCIYVYDENDGTYEKYEHTANVDESKNDVKKLQFCENGNLYFLDASGILYSLSPNKQESQDWQVTSTHFSCSNFLIHSNELYFTTSAGTGNQMQLSLTDLTAPDVSTSTCILDSLTNNCITYYNGEIYYAELGKYLNKLNPDTKASTFVTNFDTVLVSMSIESGVFASSDENGTFRAYDLTQLPFPDSAPVFTASGNYRSISAYNEKFYTVNGNIVREYDVTKHAFTDFEICDNSPAPNRLNGATETFLYKDFLYIADNGNNRISVYDTANNSFKDSFNADLPPSFLVSGETELLIANEQKAILYSLKAETFGEQLALFEDFNGNVAGVSEVYGTYYVVTENNFFYALQAGENGWTRTGVKHNSTRYPKLLASDAYGLLYVVSGTGVYRFTETQFLDPAENGEELCNSLPTNVSQFAVDYSQNFYALSDGNFYKYLTPQTANGLYEQTAVDLSATYVYGGAEYVPQITDFTFGIERNAAYLLCDGNYLVQTDVLQLPTVKSIPVSGVDEKIFANEPAEFKAVTAEKNTLLVEIDLNALQGASVFPYVAYSRTNKSTSALKIGETPQYDLLAIFIESEQQYRTYLALKGVCTELENKTYLTEYAETEQKTGYLTNALPLYKFPYMNTLLVAKETLSRETEITLLGEVTQLDREYYRVGWIDETGNVQTGYIPKAYVTSFDGAPPKTQEYLQGKEKSDSDEVWRLGYLILGFAAICVLTDYLLLRNKKEE